MAGLDGVRAAIARKRNRDHTPRTAELVQSSAQEEIDVAELLERYSVEELAVFAEAYFARVGDRRYHLVKPYASNDEAPRLLSVFGALLRTLDIVPGLTILDFGAGSCWTSHAFAQLRCKVIACDVSSTALDMGRELFAAQPVIGEAPEPTFLLFDGRTFDLPDESVDRIACTDAFHHVPNPREVLEEMFRVLRPGGLAVFAEPGPEHSLIPQSQTEMRNFVCIERDIVMEDIEADAIDIGFRDVLIGIYVPHPYFVGVADFDAALDERPEQLVRVANDFLENHRLFVLHKPGSSRLDSRRRQGLSADLAVELFDGSRVVARIKNTSAAAWLPTGSGLGEVNLGVILRDGEGRLIDLNFQRGELRADGVIAPGEEIEVELLLRLPEPGTYRLEFDLVAEGIAWFADNGNDTVVWNITIAS